MNHISIFNGIGGFQLAAEWAGWNNVMSCEIDDFCNKVTKYYWQNCKQYEDISKTDFTIWKGRADILTGGFPCQPYSNAGRRKGTDDDRYLWPEMLRAIDESRPAWVVGENVTGILTMEDKQGLSKEVFPKMESRTIVRYQEIDLYEAVYSRQKKMLVESICKDLERIGYEVQPISIPAAGVGAPHRRERIWFLAYCNGERCYNGSSHGKERHLQNNKKRNSKKNQPERNRWEFGAGKIVQNGIVANPKNKRRKSKQRQEQRQFRRSNLSINTKGITSNSNSFGQREINGQGKTKFFNQNDEIIDWQNFPTETPICNGDDGLSSRLDPTTFSKWRRESIKSGGNAIVPQVALEIFKIINDIENFK